MPFEDAIDNGDIMLYDVDVKGAMSLIEEFSEDIILSNERTAIIKAVNMEMFVMFLAKFIVCILNIIQDVLMSLLLVAQYFSV